ncbi:hypothetical protein AB0H83_44135 [Dactylosporangium sp. NPDC050688]|uniref:hypothetical protein n=1 Tax=Dactylosporangium sp. NPDC050688 TaxID=3157217 RepID=UPI0033F0AC05
MGGELLLAAPEEEHRGRGAAEANGSGEPRADAVRHAGDAQLRRSAPADDAAFGRVVRLLAAADEEMLARVESLLRDELGPGRSDFQ